MKIKSGKTRIVFLVGDKAIKFGRVRLLRLILRILLFPFMSKHNNMLFYEAYGKYFLLGMFNYLLVGIDANKREYQYYKESNDNRVVPTRKILLNGWIVIQDRGEFVSLQELEKNNPFKDVVGYPIFTEKHEYWQFCKIDGQLLLADYGRKEVCQILRESLKV
jgi:hypothetical protein